MKLSQDSGCRFKERRHCTEFEPDLFTIGKIVGGGMPIGVVCGDKELMSLANPVFRKEKESRCAIGGG